MKEFSRSHLDVFGILVEVGGHNAGVEAERPHEAGIVGLEDGVQVPREEDLRRLGVSVGALRAVKVPVR